MQDASVSRTDPSIAMSNSPAGGTANANAAAQDSTQQSGMMEPQRNIGGYVSRASTEHAVDACELHASLAGYWTDPLSLRNRRPLDTGPVGTIILHRIGKVEEGTVSVTTLAAPKDARTAYEKGWQAMGGGKLDEARRQLEKAVRLYPGFALAWARLGQLEAKLNRAEDAGRFFENAIRADPKYVQSYLGLAAVQLSQRQWEKLTSTTAQALRLDPVNYPQAYYMDAVGNYYARRLEAAEKSARQAQDLDRQHRWPQVSRILGLILASRREYRSAAIEFSKYLEMAPQAADAEEVRKLLARAEELGADTGKQ